MACKITPYKSNYPSSLGLEHPINKHGEDNIKIQEPLWNYSPLAVVFLRMLTSSLQNNTENKIVCH